MAKEAIASPADITPKVMEDASDFSDPDEGKTKDARAGIVSYHAPLDSTASFCH